MKYNSNIPGWTSPSDLTVLHKLAGLVPQNGSIIEIGCFLGRSTDALFYGKHPSVEMTVIDTFQSSGDYETDKDIFEVKTSKEGFKYVAAFGNKDLYSVAQHLTKLTGNWQTGFKYCVSNEVSNGINLYKEDFNNVKLKPSGYDLAFIDASHDFENVTKDIARFIGNQNTLIVGDDFLRGVTGVSNAILETRRGTITGKSTKRLLIVPEDTKIWMLVPVEGYWKEQFRKIDSCFF